MLKPIAAVCLATTSASAQTAMLLERATAPSGFASVSLGAGAAQRGDARLSLEADADVKAFARTSVRAGVSWTEADVSPFAGLRYQLLSNRSSGVDLTPSLTLRARGLEESGAALELRTVLSVRRGAASLVATGMVAGGLEERRDVDFDSGFLAALDIAPSFALGLETRVRGELVDRFKTPEDDGRPVEITAGPTLGFRTEAWRAALLGGYRAPRGQGPGGAIVAGTLGYEF